MNMKIWLSFLSLTAVVSIMTAPTNAVNQPTGMTEDKLQQFSIEAEKETEKAASLKLEYKGKLSAGIDAAEAKLSYEEHAAKALAASAIFAESAVRLTREVADEHAKYINTLPAGTLPSRVFIGSYWVFAGLKRVKQTLMVTTENLSELRESIESAEEHDKSIAAAYKKQEISTSYLKKVQRIFLSQQLSPEVAERELAIAENIDQIALKRLEAARAELYARIARKAAELTKS